MTKRLTEQQFEAAVRLLGARVTPQTLSIAKAVLVEGQSQAAFIERLVITRSAISQAVNRVWRAHQRQVPPGHQRLVVVLPDHKAFEIKQWLRGRKRR